MEQDESTGLSRQASINTQVPVTSNANNEKAGTDTACKISEDEIAPPTAVTDNSSGKVLINRSDGVEVAISSSSNSSIKANQGVSTDSDSCSTAHELYVESRNLQEFSPAFSTLTLSGDSFNTTQDDDTQPMRQRLKTISGGCAPQIQ